jgi:hypothetical protein
MSAFLRCTLSVILLLVLFEGMILAFHWMNLPSNLTVLAGTVLLLLLAVAGVAAFRFIWKFRSRS